MDLIPKNVYVRYVSLREIQVVFIAKLEEQSVLYLK